MKLRLLAEAVGGAHVVVKSLPLTVPLITHIPGYCWSLDGAIEIFGTPPEQDEEGLGRAQLHWPYGGEGLYAMGVRARNLAQWPFRWGWSDGKGFVGPPGLRYSPKQLRQFIKRTDTIDQVVELDRKLGNPAREPHAITRDLVKSVQPGVIVDPESTYTHNFEIIVNAPVQMRLLAVKGPGSDAGQSLFQFDYAAARALINRPSI